MHCFTLFFLICCLFSYILGRPQSATEDGNEVEERDYELESVAAAEDTREDDPRDKEQDAKDRDEAIQVQDAANSEDRTDWDHKTANDQSIPEKADYFAEYKTDSKGRLQEEKDTLNLNDNGQIHVKQPQNKYVDNSNAVDQQDTLQHLKYREVNSNIFNEREHLRNKQIEKQAQAGENLFFNEKTEMSNMENNYDSREMQDRNEQTYTKSYNNDPGADDNLNVADETYDNRRYLINRDTRQVRYMSQENENDKSTQVAINNEFTIKPVSEDAESAIKRHIRKLSKDELEELKNSLSDDKKILLKNVIDNIESSLNNNDGIIKREITKKAGAIEENNLMDSELSNSIKNQGITSDLELSTDSSVSQNTKNKESDQTESQTETTSMPTPKSSEINESDDKSEIKNGVNDINLKNKRETNTVDFPNTNEPSGANGYIDNDNKNWADSLNERECDCSQDEDSSSFVSNEFQKEYNTRNKKRQISLENQADFCDSIGSLEESFPKSNSIDESMAYSGPLIRVKRKDSDQIVKKRSAGVLPDSKVAYFPYKSENDDEDNDEGNEFDDEGFYDRTSNFAKKNGPVERGNADFTELVVNSNLRQPGIAEPILSDSDLKQRYKTYTKLSAIEKLNDEKANLGSDTDSVLSGVEGADDNLMYSSNLRDKRTISDDHLSATEKQYKPLTDSSLSPLNYQENDAFGPLPRNYEGDLGRYKRIRRLKQTHLPLDKK